MDAIVDIHARDNRLSIVGFIAYGRQSAVFYAGILHWARHYE